MSTLIVFYVRAHGICLTKHYVYVSRPVYAAHVATLFPGVSDLMPKGVDPSILQHAQVHEVGGQSYSRYRQAPQGPRAIVYR